MSLALAGFAGMCLFAAAWELAGMREPRRIRRLRARLAAARASLAARAAGTAGGAVAFVAIAPVTPGRLAPVLAVALPAAGFLAPEALVQRRVRRRRARILAALPDALDLLTVGAASGRAPAGLLREVARGGGALAAELGSTVAELETGSALDVALARLRARTGVTELGALGAALERSRRYGSPLADQLHAQAAVLRREEQRRVEDRAARAAPKIQLVVALVLVPSALLTIAAALIAHADALFLSN